MENSRRAEISCKVSPVICWGTRNADVSRRLSPTNIGRMRVPASGFSWNCSAASRLCRKPGGGLAASRNGTSADSMGRGEAPMRRSIGPSYGVRWWWWSIGPTGDNRGVCFIESSSLSDVDGLDFDFRGPLSCCTAIYMGTKCTVIYFFGGVIIAHTPNVMHVAWYKFKG